MAQTTGPAFSDSESITVTSAAIGLTAATLAGMIHAHITCESTPVRYWLDATDPSATVGHRLEVGGVIDLDSAHQLANVRFFAVGADATLRVSFAEG